MSQQRILVTGSGGQLGHELCRQFGARAVGLDLPEFDITDRDAVRSAVERHRPDVVINTAAFTHVDRAEIDEEQCRAVNARGVEHLVDACRASGVSIVQLSTDYVFDGRKATPYRETDPPNPLNVYGRTKLEAEQVVTQYPLHLIIRTAGLFGLGGPTATGNFADTMLDLARRESPIRVVDDQYTSFTYANDLARAIGSLLAVRATGTFHLTNTGLASWHELAVEIFRLSRLNVAVERVPMACYSRGAQRPRFSVLNIDKYVGIPGCYAMPSWQQAMRTYLIGRRG